MLCPNCGKKPVQFSQWLLTLNPFKIQCRHCEARLRAGAGAYVWTLFHVPLGAGVILLGRGFARSGVFEASWTSPLFVLGAIALLFSTAYVIPWLGFKDVYRVG